MNPRVQAVRANPDYTITLWFTNGEIRQFDVKPYLDKGFFQELRELHIFNTVKPFLGSVQWQNGQDFCPDTLYEESVPSTIQVNEKTARTSHRSTPAPRPRQTVPSRPSLKVKQRVR
ncbi:MAG: DUF2442 domain-containing protein [Chloroflexi bacterium]|nr:DUF2442 domain-containing protein [Chloroflexota bacterium]